MNKNCGKKEMILSIIISLMSIVLMIPLMQMNIIEKDLIVVIVIGLLLCPIIELINYKYKLYSLKGEERNLLELKLSVASWAIISGLCLVINIIMDREITWSVYPIVVLLLWPIYNMFFYITQTYSLKK